MKQAIWTIKAVTADPRIEEALDGMDSKYLKSICWRDLVILRETFGSMLNKVRDTSTDRRVAQALAMLWRDGSKITKELTTRNDI